MCGIAGFSLSSKSRINARKLSHALLCEIESRGNQASGFAFQSFKSSGVFKNDINGSNLSLKSMPRDSHTVILHTRYATHGSVKVSANNHPVTSPNNDIALVHNGVIYNHGRVRLDLPYALPEVDTSVIPALLQKFGVDALERLDGDASIAWLSEADKGVLKVGRVSHSPLFISQLEDGSFVFASTQALLLNALRSVKLRSVFLKEVPERTLFTVRAGRIDAQEVLPELNTEYEDKSHWSKSSYRQMTAGYAPTSYGSTYNYNGQYYNRDDFYGTNYDLSESGVYYGDLSPALDDKYDYLEDRFQEYLCNFIEIDTNFYDYAGNFIGTIYSLREDFEDFLEREKQATLFWENAKYESPDSHWVDDSLF